MKMLRYTLWAMVLILCAVVAGVWVGRTFFPDSAVVARSNLSAAFARSTYEDAGGPFRLLNTDGEVVTEAAFDGKPRVMFFGFTHCPDVCPTHLLDASGWLDELGADADKLEVIFVSVDPSRDTPEKLGQYVSAFDERIVGLVPPDEATLAEVAERYQVRYEKVPLQQGYTMNHSTDTLLFDGSGNYVDFIPYMPPNVRQNPGVADDERALALEKLRDLVS